MCPACLTTVVLWAAGAGSAGGLGWLVLRRPRAGAPAITDRDQETRHGPE
ncbi:hypothetical protein [Salinisphaera sp. PC39]